MNIPSVKMILAGITITALLVSCGGAVVPKANATTAPAAIAPATPTMAAMPSAAPMAIPKAATSAAPVAQSADGSTLHVAFLDLTRNITDLRVRAAEWQKGTDASREIAAEDAERIDAVLTRTAWPSELTAHIAVIQAAMPALDKALGGTNAADTKAPIGAIADSEHELMHGFYETWLPAQDTKSHVAMSAHVGFLDLSMNIADLRTRVAAWQKGDDASLDMAVEIAERIDALLAQMPWPDALAKEVGAVKAAVPGVDKALGAKDAKAVKEPLAQLADASHELTHEFYEQFLAKGATTSPECVYASYLDLAGNVADFRMRVAAWQKGDDASLDLAAEKVDRIGMVIDHVTWPDQLKVSVMAMHDQLAPVSTALTAKSQATLREPFATVAAVSHDMSHAFYESWMTEMPMMGMGAK